MHEEQQIEEVGTIVISDDSSGQERDMQEEEMKEKEKEMPVM